MLNEKLERASQEASKRRVITLITVAGIVLLLGLSIAGFSLYQELTALRRMQANKSVQTVVPVADAPPITPPQSVPSHIDDQPKVSPKSPVTAVDHVTPPAAPLATPAPLVTTAPTTAVDPIARDTFKATLKTFDQDLKPKIITDEFIKWQPEIQRDILFLKDAAIASFGEGDYGQALALLNKARDTATQALATKQGAFDQAFEQASAVKAADQYAAAKTYIDRALDLTPSSTAAQKLSREIDVLPKLINHLKAAEIARVENNSATELSHLRKVLKLDPSRKKIAARVTELALEIKEKTFLSEIRNGLSQVEKRQLKKAQYSLSNARKLFEKRDETAILTKKVATLRLDLKTEFLLKDAEAAARNDDWQASLAFYQQAKKLKPDNQLAVDGATLAQSITSLHQQVTQHLNAPARLSSKAVRAQVAAMIKRSNALSGKSVTLDRDVKALSDAMAAYGLKVSVQVVSDGQTRVSVRGVGQVGVTKGRVIKLTPGSYTFEGKRLGYKSKLVRVNIPPGSTGLRVEIFCDEPV